MARGATAQRTARRSAFLLVLAGAVLPGASCCCSLTGGEKIAHRTRELMRCWAHSAPPQCLGLLLYLSNVSSCRAATHVRWQKGTG